MTLLCGQSNKLGGHKAGGAPYLALVIMMILLSVMGGVAHK